MGIQKVRATDGIFAIAAKIKKRASVYGIYNNFNKLIIAKHLIKRLEKTVHALEH